MSSTEPPSRILPKGLSHETKSAQEDVASSRKVEKIQKVGEIDADERARQQKFRRLMSDDETEGTDASQNAPSPFDLFTEDTDNKGVAEASIFTTPAASVVPTPPSSFGDMDDAIVASPSYTPSPNIATPPPEEETDEEATTGALPRSGDFWDEVDMPPDRPLEGQNLQETPKSAARFAKEVPPGAKPSTGPKGKKGGAGIPIKSHEEASFFGPPGKPAKGGPAPKAAHAKSSKEGKKPPLPSPFEQTGKKQGEPDEDIPASARYHAPKGKKSDQIENKAANVALREREGVVFQITEREMGGARKGKEQKVVAIDAPSLPLLPTEVQPATFTATSAATPYLHPSTLSLYFQMVGTLYVMTTPPGISRTEVVLNNPAFANSRFYGTTITIEKYATAPDSFNIRLSGSNDAAVKALKENIPSLITAFENSRLPFRVHRIEAEYTTERPVFRRRERGEGGSEADSGGFSERRK